MIKNVKLPLQQLRGPYKRPTFDSGIHVLNLQKAKACLPTVTLPTVTLSAEILSAEILSAVTLPAVYRAKQERAARFTAMGRPS